MDVQYSIFIPIPLNLINEYVNLTLDLGVAVSYNDKPKIWLDSAISANCLSCANTNLMLALF
jgi:hypothetical protein